MLAAAKPQALYNPVADTIVTSDASKIETRGEVSPKQGVVTLQVLFLFADLCTNLQKSMVLLS